MHLVIWGEKLLRLKFTMFECPATMVLDEFTGLYRPVGKMTKADRALRKDRLGLRSRLLSIISDASFVDRVHDVFALAGVPTFANLRQGFGTFARRAWTVRHILRAQMVTGDNADSARRVQIYTLLCVPLRQGESSLSIVREGASASQTAFQERCLYGVLCLTS